MLNDQALNRLYEAMGVAGDSPMMVGRQRRIKAAVEAAYPDIRTSVAAEIAEALDKRPDPDGYFFWGPQFADIIRREYEVAT